MWNIVLMDGSWFDQACGLCRACGSEPDRVAASVWTCYTQVPGHELKVYYRRKIAVRLWLDWVTEWRSHSEKQAYNKDCVKVSNDATSVDGQKREQKAGWSIRSTEDRKLAGPSPTPVCGSILHLSAAHSEDACGPPV